MPVTPATQEWIDDLRANSDKQGKARLETSLGQFCCLGRLCLIAEKHGVKVRRRYDWRLYGETLKDQGAVKAWARVNIDPYIGEHGELYDDVDLATLNDRGVSFAEIADLIKRNYEEHTFKALSGAGPSKPFTPDLAQDHDA